MLSGNSWVHVIHRECCRPISSIEVQEIAHLEQLMEVICMCTVGDKERDRVVPNTLQDHLSAY